MAKTQTPEPCNCRKCGRPPVVVKVRRGQYRVACPYLDCEVRNSFGNTEAEAIKKWNDGEVVKA